MVTGESMPVDVTQGASVIGSTMNINGSIVIRATKVGKDTMLSRITTMVEEAQNSKAPIERLADMISSKFVPAVLIISVLSLAAWLFIGVYTLPVSQAFAYAISAFIGVLVIACPCALGLATPTAMIVAVGRGAKNGILIKDAESLERFGSVNTIVMDKTGTLTKGKPEVVGVEVVSGALPVVSDQEIIKILASLEQHSEHPIAHAILEKAKLENITPDTVEGFRMVRGLGVEGMIGGEIWRAGNGAFMRESHVSFDQTIIENETREGKTPVFLAKGNDLTGLVFVADALKDNAKHTVETLKKQGITVVMLSGDNEQTARFIAQKAGIDHVVAGVLPDEKAHHIEKLKADGKTVAMVGDGVNDAPALATADVGIALSTGTDVAMSTANITLLHGDIAKVLIAIRLSKKTMTIIKENLFWAFAYNVIGIPIAAGILYPTFGILLSPAFAGIAMAASSVSVVTNSLRLKRVKI